MASQRWTLASANCSGVGSVPDGRSEFRSCCDPHPLNCWLAKFQDQALDAVGAQAQLNITLVLESNSSIGLQWLVGSFQMCSCQKLSLFFTRCQYFVAEVPPEASVLPGLRNWRSADWSVWRRRKHQKILVMQKSSHNFFIGGRQGAKVRILGCVVKPLRGGVDSSR